MRNTSTIPHNIFIYGCSLEGSSFEQLIHLDTTIVSIFFKKKKKKNQKEEERKKKEMKRKKKNNNK